MDVALDWTNTVETHAWCATEREKTPVTYMNRRIVILELSETFGSDLSKGLITGLQK